MIIRLRDMLFHAYHGVLAQERLEGNTFRVSVQMTLPDLSSEPNDDLTATLDYRQVYDLVRAEMKTPSQLLEHVAWRIRHTLTLAFPDASDIHVTVAKQQPPLGGNVAWAEIEL